MRVIEDFTDWEKQLLGFLMFTSTMRMPTTAKGIEALILKLDVEEQFKHYANDWINYSQKTETGPRKDFDSTPDEFCS